MLLPLYLQSDHFQRSLTRTLTETLSRLAGGTVVIDEAISVESLFPRVKVSLPTARMRASTSFDALNRARLQGLQLTLSPGVLLSGGTSGRVAARMDSFALIIDRADAPQVAALPVLPSGFTPALSQQVSEALAGVLDLSPQLDIDTVDLIVRDAGSPQTHLRLENLSLRSDADMFALNTLIGPPGAVDGTLDITLSADSLSAELTSAADSPPHEFSTNLTLDGNRVSLGDLTYRGPDAWLRGDIDIDASAEPVEVTGALELRQLQLDTEQLAGNTVAAERLFSYQPFTFGLPANLRATIDVTLGAIRLDQTPLVSGALAISVDQARARVTAEQLFLLGGDSDLELELATAWRGIVDLSFKLSADDVQLDRLRARTDASPILSRGTADLLVSLSGSGPSPGHVAASLDGYLTAAVDSAEINRTWSTAIDRGIIRWGSDRLAALSGQATRAPPRLSDPLQVDCAAFRFYVNDGRIEASNGVVLELPENTLFSSGFVDFSDESLGFVFRSRTRSLFDWSALSFVKYAELRGTLSTPLATLNATELAKQGLRSASSMVWGPLPGMVYSLAESGLRNRQDMRCDPSIQ